MLPPTRQERQPSVQVVAQQTPCSQFPVLHSPSPPQSSPFGLRQSKSWLAEQFDGHWPSDCELHGRGIDRHWKLQVEALPLGVRMVSRSLLQEVLLQGSQSSPESRRLLPQPGQSASVRAVQLDGHWPSPAWQGRGRSLHLKVQLFTSPEAVRKVWASSRQLSALTRQAEGGSQVSPFSSRPFPQPEQSASVAAVQDAGH
jgi:hypothetical protein